VTHSTREKVAERLELAASLAWLFMDLAWMEGSPTGAVACALPTVLCSFAAIPFVPREFTARAITAAMAAWAVMNALWMLTDLEVYDGLVAARVCFAAGLGLLLAALWRTRSTRALFAELTRTFRRLRAGRR
jgi:hypothetical protein